ncbi:MAG: TIGR04086 family membrane protein [Ruminococcaceae bacterium]|nr:TIGR04086 family membrane protein [Oscillospiraceae bacterium]
MNKQTAGNTPTALNFIVNCLTASLAASVIMTILLGISAVILNTFQNPESLYGMFSIVVYIITSVICGIIAKRKNSHSALLCGLISTIFLVLILLAVSSIIPGFEVSAPVWQPVILLIGAILGAFITK